MVCGYLHGVVGIPRLAVGRRRWSQDFEPPETSLRDLACSQKSSVCYCSGFRTAGGQPASSLRAFGGGGPGQDEGQAREVAGGRAVEGQRRGRGPRGEAQ